MGKIKNGTWDASMDLFLDVYVYIVFACMYVHGSLYKNTDGAVGCTEVKVQKPMPDNLSSFLDPWEGGKRDPTPLGCL